MEIEKTIYDEKQFMGHNQLSIIWRTILTLFCFLGYYWSENPKPVSISGIHIGSYPVADLPNSGTVFFIVGLFILLLSVAFTYILHTHIRVYHDYFIIDGFWTARKVKVDLNSIIKIRKSRYKKNIFRRAVYNLHSRGIIKFYTSGRDFIELKDKAGFTYRIGTQRSAELYNLLKKQIQEIKNKEPHSS